MRTLVLLKNFNSGNFEIHPINSEIDEQVKQMYIEEGYYDKEHEYIYHWNNVHSTVRLSSSLESNLIIGTTGRANWTPNNISYEELSNSEYFDLDHGASEESIILKTDDKYYTADFYIKYISEKIENTPNLYD